MIVGLVSTYMEGPLALAAVGSALEACDAVVVMDGPLRGVEAKGHPTPVDVLDRMARDHRERLTVTVGEWRDDAAKRTMLLEWAKRLHRAADDNEPLWCLWVDGDEQVQSPQNLQHWCYRADRHGTTGAGGFAMRIVELDGSVAYGYGRVFRGDLVERFLVAASQVELVGGMVVGLPNDKICSAGGMPVSPEDGWRFLQRDPDAMEAYLARHRPPLIGEPHILHLSYLRHPDRTDRQYRAEVAAVEGLAGEAADR